MWDVTRQHLISQQKAQIRAQHLVDCKTNSIMPVEFYGAEPLKRYYATNGGQISEAMQALITRHANEKAEQVLKELKAQADREMRNATYFAGLTRQIYEHEDDTGFDNANVALQKVVTFYQKTETDRLEALFAKESQRQPTTPIEWTNLLCQPLNLPRSDRSGSRGRKRQRRGSPRKASANNAAPTPGTSNRPPPPQTPSTSNTRLPATNVTRATPSNSRGNLNNHAAHPKQNQQGPSAQPFVSANYRGKNPKPQYQRQQQPSNQGHRTQNAPRRQDANNLDDTRRNNSGQHARSNSTERMLAAITALKAAMK